MTTAPITFRRAGVSDAAGISALVVHVLHVSSTPDYGVENIARVASHFSPGSVAALAQRNHMIVAEADGRTVGTASLGGTAGDISTYALRTFFVDPDLQGKGIGTQMLAILEDEARRRGMTDLPVRASIGGKPFYVARGFEVISEVWCEDELTYQMRKSLT